MPRTSYAIWWLILIHALADVAVGVYRVHDLERSVTDVLSAALAQGQFALLAIWLAAGADPLSWRLCGLVGGGCFIFVVFTRTALPGSFDIGGQAYWLEEEWAYYFRLTAPGDLLVKAPVLIGAAVVPLAGIRLVRRLRAGRAPADSKDRRYFQFGLREAAVWTVTISLTLAAIFRTAPYEEWVRELAGHWREAYRLNDAAAAYTLGSAAMYALIALTATWAVYGRTALRIRAPVSLVLVVGIGYGLQTWLHGVATSRASDPFLDEVWAQTSSEAAIGLLMFANAAGSLALYRAYHVYFRRGAGAPSRHSVQGVGRNPF